MTNLAKRALLCAVVVGLAGCGSMKAGEQQLTVPEQSKARVVLNVTGAPQAAAARDWQAFRAEWQSAFKAEADAAGIAFVWQDGPVKPLGQAGTLLAVEVRDYRLVPSAAGDVPTHVNAQLRYLSLADGRPFGERAVSSNGLSAARPLQAIAREAMRQLKRTE